LAHGPRFRGVGAHSETQGWVGNGSRRKSPPAFQGGTARLKGPARRVLDMVDLIDGKADFEKGHKASYQPGVARQLFRLDQTT
jgi:hypothetical protein